MYLGNCRAPRWLQVSQGQLQQLSLSDGHQAAATVLHAAYQPDQPSDLHLQQLLAATKVDHAFYVQSWAEADSAAADSEQLWQRSMAQALGAHIRSGQSCRASVVMPADFGALDAGALGVARTLFMEHRAMCGPALLLDPAAPPLSQQVWLACKCHLLHH